MHYSLLQYWLSSVGVLGNSKKAIPKAQEFQINGMFIFKKLIKTEYQLS
jgi:hypothetical protein